MSQASHATRMAQIFDSKRASGLLCYLLKRTEHSSTLASLGQLTSGWFVEFSEIRGAVKFYYATSSTVTDTWARATHFAYGTGSSLEVFEFVIEEKDDINPDGKSPFWTSSAVRLDNERFTV